MLLKVNLYLNVEGESFDPVLLREIMEKRIYDILDGDSLTGTPPSFNLTRLPLSQDKRKGLKKISLLTKDEALEKLK